MRFLIVAVLMLASCGCAMFGAWRAIPPPGGCDQCHTVPISANWHITYQAATLTDETKHQLPFQREESTMPPQDKPASPLEERKVEEQRCFACHKSPTPAHTGRTGRFHH